MKKIFLWLMVLTAFFSGAFAFKEPLTSEINKIIHYSYCDKPISYRLGTIDPQFNITNKQFLSDVKQAADIWNQIEGKELFIFDSKALLKINMVFDERQSLKNQIDILDTKTSQQKENILPNINQYDQLTSQFNKKIAGLNSEIAYWNSQGGAPSDVYDRLIEEQNQLRQEAERLRQMAQNLNRSTKIYNEQVRKLNQTISSFNQVLTERPEEGVYDPKENKIDIYFMVNKEELIHTLAHEFGHALSLRHDNDKKSIMYPYTTQVIKASAGDISAVNEYCRQRSKLEYIYNEVKLRLSALRYLIN